MKKALVLALCVVGFILIAAPTAVEYAPLFINGKPAGQVVMINGIPSVSVQSTATALGLTLTLQPNLQRQGNRLLALLGNDTMKHKDAATEKWTPAPATAAGTPAAQPGALKQSGQGEFKFFTPAPGQILRVNKPGEISSHVFDFEGKGYYPLTDLIRALGGNNNTITGGVFKANQPIRLNSSSTGILIGL